MEFPVCSCSYGRSLYLLMSVDLHPFQFLLLDLSGVKKGIVFTPFYINCINISVWDTRFVLVEPFKTSLLDPRMREHECAVLGRVGLEGSINTLWVAANKIRTDSDVNPPGE